MDKTIARDVKKKLKKKRKQMIQDESFSSAFSILELEDAISSLKTNKAPGYDYMFSEFFKHFGSRVKQWLLTFYNNILEHGRLPSQFKQAKVITVLKPGKIGSSASDYRPISLLSISFKLFERLILNRIESTIDEKLPIEQAAFRKNRGCSEQVLAMSTSIEKGFQEGVKSFITFVDLSSAYDTVWREGLLLKLADFIPCIKL